MKAACINKAIQAVHFIFFSVKARKYLLAATDLLSQKTENQKKAFTKRINCNVLFVTADVVYCSYLPKQTII